MNPTIKGDTTVIWGASGVYAGSGVGHVISGRKKKSAQLAEIPDVNGFTVAAVLYDHTTEVEFEMAVKTSAPSLERGDLATICGVTNCMILDIELLWGNKNVQVYRVTAKCYEGMTHA